MKQESLYIDRNDHRLHLRHIWQKEGGYPVFMLHGAIENGRIFYTHSGKGLACYLAKHGFDVYVADTRGRGDSLPKIDNTAHYGQFETITQEIPAFLARIRELNPLPIHVVSHSWGGVLMASYWARYPNETHNIASNICFGTKRTISIRSVEKMVKVNLLWNKVAPMLARKLGYFNAKKLGVGSDNETAKSLQHSVAWVNQGQWVDLEDGFNYKQAVEDFNWPPTWHLTGLKDSLLGNAVDVKRFIKESGNNRALFSLLSKANGNKLDYDHINILTAPEAVHDHFPKLVHWMAKQNQATQGDQ